MLVVASQQDAHGRWGQMRLACQQGTRIGAIKALLAIKENHLFRFSLGVKICDNLEGISRLHERHLHVETAQVHAQNGTGVTSDRKQQETCGRPQHLGASTGSTVGRAGRHMFVATAVRLLTYIQDNTVVIL